MCKRVHMQKENKKESAKISKAGATGQTGIYFAAKVYLVRLLTSRHG